MRLLMLCLTCVVLSGCDVMGIGCDRGMSVRWQEQTPVFDWDRGCNITELRVVDPDLRPAWVVMSNGSIRPPVRYGQVPAGAESIGGPARELVPDVEYFVAVYRGDRGKMRSFGNERFIAR